MRETPVRSLCQKDPLKKGQATQQFSWASLVAQTVTNPSAMHETWVRSLVGKMPCGRNSYPLQYSALENSMDRGAWQSMGSQTVGND